ncbi:pyrophosphatase [Aureococcus anophagefferens]|nr:pyrophosphatase [Aureococcus anophagefferens]
MADPWEEEALRAVELAAEGDGEFAFRCLRSAFLRSGASVLTTVEAQGDGSFRFGADAVVRDAVEVVDGDSLLHMLIRNGADARCVEACVELGADVMQPNGRGEHCLGMARKRIARAGELRGRGVAAKVEAAARKDAAVAVAALVEKARGRQKGTSSGLLRLGTPGSPAAKRRPASPQRRVKPRPRSAGARPKSAAARPVGEVDAWRRASGLAQRAAAAAEARRAGFAEDFGAPRDGGEDLAGLARLAVNEAAALSGAGDAGESATRLVAKARDDLGRALGERDGLIRERAEEIEKNAALSRQLRDCDAAAEAAAARVRMLKRAAAEAEVDKARALDDASREAAKSDRLARQLEALDGERLGLRGAVDDLKREVAELRRDEAALAEERRRAREAIVGVYTRMRALGAETERLEAEHAERRARSDASRAEGLALEAENAARRRRFDELREARAPPEAARGTAASGCDVHRRSKALRAGLASLAGEAWADEAAVAEVTGQLLEGDDALRSAAYALSVWRVLAGRRGGAAGARRAGGVAAGGRLRGVGRDARRLRRLAVAGRRDAAPPGLDLGRRDGVAVCAAPGSEGRAPGDGWVDDRGETDAAWRLERAAPPAKPADYEFPTLELRLFEVDALQKAVAIGSLELRAIDAQLEDLATAGGARVDEAVVPALKARAKKVAGATRPRALSEHIFVSTVSTIAPDLDATRARYRALYGDLTRKDPAGFEAVHAALGALDAGAEKDKERQTLSLAAMREFFGPGRDAPKPPDDDAELLKIGAAVDAALGRSAVVVLLAPIKSLGRAFSKVHEKYGGRYDGLTDLLRGTLQCDGLDALEAAAKLLGASAALEVIRVKNRLHASFDADAASGGYRDVLTNVKVGHVVAEVQLNLEAFVEIKEGSGHAVYEAARVIHFFDPLLKRHAGTPTSLTARALPRCEDDDDRPVCVADRVACGQLQEVDLVGAGGADNRLEGPEPGLDDKGDRSRLSAPTERNAWAAAPERPFAAGVEAAAAAGLEPPAFTASGAGNADLDGDYYAFAAAAARWAWVAPDGVTVCVADGADGDRPPADAAAWRDTPRRALLEPPPTLSRARPCDGEPWTLSVSNVYASGAYGITASDAAKLLSRATDAGAGTCAASEIRAARGAGPRPRSPSRPSTAGATYLRNAALEVLDGDTWRAVARPSGGEERLAVDAVATDWRLAGSYLATSRLFFECDRTAGFRPEQVPSTAPCDDVAWELEVVDGEAGFGDDAPVRVSRVTVAALNRGSYGADETLADKLAARLEVLLDDDETWETVAEVPDSGTWTKETTHHLEIDASGSVWRLRGKDVATSRFFFETNHKKGYKPAQILEGQPVDGQPWTLSVSNVYGSGSYGITSDDASKLLTEATNEGTGTYSGTSEICATFEEPVRVRGVTVAPLDGWGGSYLSNATLQVCLDDGEWLDLEAVGAEERIEVDAIGSSFVWISWRRRGSSSPDPPCV